MTSFGVSTEGRAVGDTTELPSLLLSEEGYWGWLMAVAKLGELELLSRKAWYDVPSPISEGTIPSPGPYPL